MHAPDEHTGSLRGEKGERSASYEGKVKRKIEENKKSKRKEGVTRRVGNERKGRKKKRRKQRAGRRKGEIKHIPMHTVNKEQYG